MFDTPLRSLMMLVIVAIVLFAAAFTFEANKQVLYSRIDLKNDQEENALLVKLGRLEPEETFVEEQPMEVMEPADPETIVLWLHISGFRTDYLAQANPPFLSNSNYAAYSSKRLTPVFPTLSRPNLASQITGLEVADHGIYADSVRDSSTGEIVDYPTDPKYLKGEPIWATAKGQGIRTLVHDWPFSQVQSGDKAADIFLSEFDPEATDEQRLQKLYDAWMNDTGEEKLKLVMGCLYDIEKAAQTHGCRDDATLEAVRLTDRHLKDFFDKVEDRFDTPKHQEDELHIFITTDRGMADVKTKIEFVRLVPSISDQISYALNDSLALVWFNEDAADKDALATAFDDAMSGQVYMQLFPPEEYQAEWGLGEAKPDRVVQLQPGYIFTEDPGSEAVYPAEETNGPFAGAGYQVAATSRMRGQMMYFRMPSFSGPNELPEISPTQFPATICSLLEIQPAAGANTESILPEAPPSE